MAGRRPKPTALHKLEGTYHATRHGKGRAAEPKPQGDLKEPPDWLTSSQVESWDYAIRNMPKGLLKRLDRGLLAAWCVAENNLRTANMMLRLFNEEPGRLPNMILTPFGWKTSPYFDQITDSVKIMLSTSDRLGFSPVSRPRIWIEPEKPKEEAGPWAALRRFPIVIPGGKDPDQLPTRKKTRKKNGSKA